MAIDYFTDYFAGLFDDLDNYKTKPEDGVVLGQVKHKKTGNNEVEITIEAFQVKNVGGSGDKEKDEL